MTILSRAFGLLEPEIQPDSSLTLAAKHPIYLVLGAIVLVIAVVALLIYWPKRQVSHLRNLNSDAYFDAENEARRTLVQMVGGLFVLIGLFFTWQNLVLTQHSSQEAIKLSESGQITERLTRAIDQLSSNAEDRGGTSEAGKHLENRNMPVRLGGIYALEMIAKQNESYHWQIMEVLAAYLRQYAPRGSDAQVKSEDMALTRSEAKADIAAAVTVIRRRDRSRADKENEQLDFGGTNLQGLAFSEAIMRGANFSNSQLREARFDQAHLERAIFRGAHLFQAHFDGAILTGAVDFSGAWLVKTQFVNCDLENANFANAHLIGTDFRKVKTLNGATFDGADLTGAHFEGVDLTKTFGLTWKQLSAAFFEGAMLPPEVEDERSQAGPSKTLK
jgi:uncharacterized protein YjbI with pentapeptide repeats